jgi:hypothetical protein
VPLASVTEVVQDAAAAVAVQSVAPSPSVNVTVPVAPVGMPEAVSVEADPYATWSGEAAAVIVDVAAIVPAVSAPVDPVLSVSPEYVAL